MLLKQCKNSKKQTAKGGSRLIVDEQLINGTVATMMTLGSTSEHHADHGTTILVNESAKKKKKDKKKGKKEKRTIEEKQQALQRMCASLQKHKAAMPIADYVENILYDVYLLGKLPQPGVRVKPRRNLSEMTESIITSSVLSKLDLYDAVNQMLLSVPSHSTTCEKLCPCAVVNRKQKVCSRPLVRARGDGRCVQVDDPDFIPGGDGRMKKSDKSGQRKETRCSTVAFQQKPAGTCGAGTPPWKTGFAFFNSNLDNAFCAHFTLAYYCDPANSLSCAGGKRSEGECCKTKCSERMCNARRQLFETFGVVNLSDSGKCLLKGLAADVSFNVLNQQRHCREVCEKTFKD